MRLAFQILVFVLISSVLVAGFSVPIPFIPALGEKARILYFHVPTAWVSVVAFFMSMLYSIKYLRSGDPVTDLKSFSANSLGFLFACLQPLPAHYGQNLAGVLSGTGIRDKLLFSFCC